MEADWAIENVADSPSSQIGSNAQQDLAFNGDLATMRIGSATAFNLILASAMVAFALNSYPMMQPGFDMWWHMAMTEAPQLADPTAFPSSRILWHYFWHEVLGLFEIEDFFSRALVIHRTQYLLTLCLLTLSAYLSMRSVLHKSNPNRQLLLTASLLASVIWLLMTGTASSPRESGPESMVVQSWIQWYSLNYQISLPVYFAATASLLYALSTPISNWKRGVWVAVCAALICIGTLAHAAETANFLICLCFLGCFFMRGRHAQKLAVGLVLLSGGAIWMALDQSYLKPELFTRLAALDFPSLAQYTSDLGHAMVDGDLSRNATGWNAMHSISFAAMALILAAVFLTRQINGTGSQIGLRAMGFLLATASLPLALFYQYSAGVLAMITHMYIAWRFSFASFLFVGLPLFSICLSQSFANLRTFQKQLVTFAVVGLGVSGALVYSYHFESVQPSFQFGRSLISSLDREKSHFGWTPDRLSQMRALVTSLRSKDESQPYCTDISTAYYLFFIEKFKAVVLPEDLSYLPGFTRSSVACDFSARVL